LAGRHRSPLCKLHISYREKGKLNSKLGSWVGGGIRGSDTGSRIGSDGTSENNRGVNVHLGPPQKQSEAVEHEKKPTSFVRAKEGCGNLNG